MQRRKKLNWSLVLIATVFAVFSWSASAVASLSLNFEVTTISHFYRYLDEGNLVTEQDPSHEPVTFHIRIDFHPIYRGFEQKGDDPYKTVYTHFQYPTHVGSTPFSDEMDDYNRFGFTDLQLNPWYCYSRSTEYLFGSSGGALFAVSYGWYGTSGSYQGEGGVHYYDNYHHAIGFQGSNSLFAPSSFDDMDPWTREKLLEFISHEDTMWSFSEFARSETATVDGDYTFYDEVVYTGTADLCSIPIPGAIWLVGSGLVGLVGLRKKFKK